MVKKYGNQSTTGMKRVTKNPSFGMSANNFLFATRTISQNTAREIIRTAFDGKSSTMRAKANQRSDIGSDDAEDDLDLDKGISTPKISKRYPSRRSIQPPKRYGTGESVFYPDKKTKISSKASDRDGEVLDNMKEMLPPKHPNGKDERSNSGTPLTSSPDTQQEGRRGGRPPKPGDKRNLVQAQALVTAKEGAAKKGAAKKGAARKAAARKAAAQKAAAQKAAAQKAAAIEAAAKKAAAIEAAAKEAAAIEAAVKEGATRKAAARKAATRKAAAKKSARKAAAKKAVAKKAAAQKAAAKDAAGKEDTSNSGTPFTLSPDTQQEVRRRGRPPKPDGEKGLLVQTQALAAAKEAAAKEAAATAKKAAPKEAAGICHESDDNDSMFQISAFKQSHSLMEAAIGQYQEIQDMEIDSNSSEVSTLEVPDSGAPTLEDNAFGGNQNSEQLLPTEWRWHCVLL